MWADMAPVNGVPFIMRDVTLWAFTVPFFEEREDELKEFEAGMAELTDVRRGVPRAAQRDPDARHDRPARLDRRADARPARARRTSSSRSASSKRAPRRRSPEPSGRPRTGGHACVWEHPSAFNQAFLSYVDKHRA